MAITTNNLISRQTVGSAGATSITFSNIPQTFTDLKVVVSGRTDYANSSDEVYLKLNGSSASIYSWKMLYGTGSAAASASDSAEGYGIAGVQIDGSTATASVFSNGEIYIPNYTSANYKSISMEHCPETNATAINMKMVAGLWSSTAAITSLSLSGGTGNFVQYSTFSLYGISSSTSTQNTSIPSATGGDVITTDGTYWYHQFLYSGTFTPLKALTADYLVVAGGGGGGTNISGGGGGGGFRTSTGLSLTTTGYTCTVGAGGAGAPTATGNNGSSGSNSVFSTITSSGGGGGAGSGAVGITGGSGGGGSGGFGAGAGGAGNSGSYSPVEGYAGGSGTQGGAPNYYAFGGGGGGSSAVGVNAVLNTSAGNGGAGTSNSYSGASITYAGGGGGAAGTGTQGAGGTGGGGAGNTSSGVAGTANLGGGGGSGNSGGAAGGSGIVLIRYAV